MFLSESQDFTFLLFDTRNHDIRNNLVYNEKVNTTEIGFSFIITRVIIAQNELLCTVQNSISGNLGKMMLCARLSFKSMKKDKNNHLIDYDKMIQQLDQNHASQMFMYIAMHLASILTMIKCYSLLGRNQRRPVLS